MEARRHNPEDLYLISNAVEPLLFIGYSSRCPPAREIRIQVDVDIEMTRSLV